MHFNVRKLCMPIYDDEEDLEEQNDEDENGNVHVRKAIGMQMTSEKPLGCKWLRY